MPYDICFCADRKYLKHVVQVITSALANNTCQFNFYLITDSDTVNEAVNSFENQNLGVTLKILTIDTSLYAGLKEISHFTTGMYYRLSIPDLIPSERVLYLDCDVTINGDLEELFKLDFQDNYVAAVDNPFFYRHESLGMNLKWGYFNSGVMLINTKAWLENNIKDRVVEFVTKNEKHLISPDQDALNAVFAGKWYRLPLKYNAQTSMYKKVFDIRKILPSQVSQLSDPTIIHYSSSSKPWMNCDAHALKCVYQKYSDIRETSDKGLLWDFSLFVFNYLRDRLSFLVWRYFFKK
jgi:lipopolysaccharide biosynthesis glycosyltransferase